MRTSQEEVKDTVKKVGNERTKVGKELKKRKNSIKGAVDKPVIEI